MMLFCIKCNLPKDTNSFYKRGNGSLRRECKDCLARLRDLNKENIATKKKLWQLKNKEHLKEYDKSYYSLNKERLNTGNNIYHKTRYKTDLNFKIRKQLRSRLSQAVNKSQKVGSAIKDLGCSIDFLKKYFETLFQPNMTWDNWGEWEIDHIEPLCKFDLTIKEQFEYVVNYKNLQPIWKSEHIIKSTKDRGEYGKIIRNS